MMSSSAARVSAGMPSLIITKPDQPIGRRGRTTCADRPSRPRWRPRSGSPSTRGSAPGPARGEAASTAALSASVTMSRSWTVGIRAGAGAGPARGGPRRGRPASGHRARARLRTKSRRAASVSRSTAADWRSAGDGLDVEALVRLEQLERLERQAGPLVRRARAALADDPAERRDPAEALVGLEHPVAFDAAIHLGSLAELIEQVHLVPAGDAAGRHPRVQQLVGPLQERVQRFGRRAAPRASGRSARRGTTRSPRTRASRAGPARHARPAPRSRHRTCGRGRGRRSARRTVRGCRRGATSGRRTPLAIALSLPPVGVMSVRTRSASPRSNLDSTMASVV